jgi:hypothetical protein
MARQTRGDRAEQEGEETVNVIPAPGVPGTESTVSQPQANYPEPGTGPKQPGFTMSHEQMVGESNEEFEDRALEAEEEAKKQTEEQREEQAKKDEEAAQASQEQMERRDQEREQRRQERTQRREERAAKSESKEGDGSE